jgi:hypothetical protein
LGKSFTGPDWTDVALAMKAVERIHACTLYVHLTSDSYSESPGFQITCVAIGMEPSPDLVPRSAGVRKLWPNPSHSTLEGTVFALVYDLDHVLGATWYVQRTLETA